jgi:hypothetical protein
MTTTYDYTDEEIANPSGRNSQSARAKFFQRSLYKEVIYPEDIAKPLDSWYDKNLYGRVNQDQTSIIPRQSNLVQIDYGVQPNMFCLNFVNIAFSGLVEHMKTAYLTNCIDRGGNSSLYNIRAVISYSDWLSSYNTHTTKIAQAFINNYVASYEFPIKNFIDFKHLYIKYLFNMVKNMPITLTSYVLSPFASTFGSGLKIAIAQQDAGNDSVKYDEFINDPNFKFYARAAKKYGFLVDKYVPWVLTYDLFTDASLKYINYYLTDEGQKITEQNFFDTYYSDTNEVDLSLLRFSISRAYQIFIQQKPFYEEMCGDSKLVTKTREPLGAQALTTKELIDLYIDLRNAEVNYEGPSTKKTKRRAYEIFKTQPSIEMGRSKVVKFVDETYKNFIYPKNYGQLNPSLDIAVLSDIVDTVAETAVAIQSTY